MDTKNIRNGVLGEGTRGGSVVVSSSRHQPYTQTPSLGNLHADTFYAMTASLALRAATNATADVAIKLTERRLDVVKAMPLAAN